MSIAEYSKYTVAPLFKKRKKKHTRHISKAVVSNFPPLSCHFKLKTDQLPVLEQVDIQLELSDKRSSTFKLLAIILL